MMWECFAAVLEALNASKSKAMGVQDISEKFMAQSVEKKGHRTKDDCLNLKSF